MNTDVIKITLPFKLFKTKRKVSPTTSFFKKEIGTLNFYNHRLVDQACSRRYPTKCYNLQLFIFEIQ